jgi:membrane-associated phospholipid phosphatase
VKHHGTLLTERARSLRIAAAAFVAALSCASPAAADPTSPAAGAGEPTEWTFRTFEPVDYIVTGITGALAIDVYFEIQPQPKARWVGGILFDDAARSAFRLRDPGARDAVRNSADLLAAGSVVLAVGVDALAVPLLRKRTKAAIQLGLISAETFALSSLVTTTAYDSVGRARPSYADCQKNPSFDPQCNTSPTASFWSGHTAQAFTAAGLSCAEHAFVHIYGDPLADALACAGMITLGASVGALRVMGDRHYATDVLTGSLVGFALGYILPATLYYTRRKDPSEAPIVAVSQTNGGYMLLVSKRF